MTINAPAPPKGYESNGKMYVPSNRRILRENTTSKVHLNVGARGAGKTLLMVRMICLALIICEWINNLYGHMIGSKYFMRPLRVWSNVNVTFSYCASQDGATWPGAQIPKVLSTLPLDMHKLFKFDDEMQWGFIFIDELDQNADRQDWQNGGQKLFMKILVQIRKLHLSLTATIQSLGWVNPRLMFQVDTSTLCRDAARTAWGMANDLEPGVVTFTYTQDRSGALTGYTYEESGQVFESQLFGQPLHDLYNTDEVRNPWEQFESVKVNRKRVVIDPFDKNEVESYGDDIKILESLIMEQIKKKELKIRRSQFFRAAQAKGLVMNKSEAEAYLEDVHNVRSYGSAGIVKLDFTNVKSLYAASKGRKPRAAKKETEIDAE